MAEVTGVLGRIRRKSARLLRLPFRVRLPTAWIEWLGVHLVHRGLTLRLTVERWWSVLVRRDPRPRVMATACWSFPIYSQTFVYQELHQLMTRGFAVRFVYSHLETRDHLPGPLQRLWRVRRRLLLHRYTAASDYARYRRRAPERVASLVELLCAASGLPRETLLDHPHFLRAFSYTRLVEAYRPDYLHSYFFYEGSLFSLVAGYLLGIPRGVSCYADHLLDDYDLKVVTLHLQLADVTIATSRRIREELVGIAPDADPDRIVVKPNAIDSTRFPSVARAEPAPGQPFRLVCVGRIDPKKGMVHLVEALAILRDRGIDVECRFVGAPDRDQPASEEYDAVLRNRIDELQVREIARLEGRRDQAELPALFEHSHLFVAPYVELANGDKDGIPTTLLEAMATGLPVVTTDAGSIGEVVRDGQDGVIVPQRDSQALATAVADLLRNPARRATLGAQAVERVREGFDVAVCEHRFHDRVEEIIGRGGTGKSLDRSPTS